MPLLTKSELVDDLCPPLDALLASQLIDELISLERRFVLRDWEPAELDGGQFCEICARVLYHIDSGNLNHGKEFDKCLSYIENDSSTHNHLPRKELLHLAKVLRTVYRFRSDRGAVHISATYSPNHMDARLVSENVRWCFAEVLRIFWNSDREEVARTIRNLLRFDTPCIGVYGDRLIVQRVDLKPEEEILVLLHHSGEEGLTQTELSRHSYLPRSTLSDVLQRLVSPTYRQAVKMPDGRYRLTDLGARRVREDLAAKLNL